MTCTEFRTLLARDPDNCTRAEIMAVIKHSSECDSCGKHMEEAVSEVEEFFASLGPEVERLVDQKARMSAKANYRRVTDSDDPELEHL